MEILVHHYIRKLNICILYDTTFSLWCIRPNKNAWDSACCIPKTGTRLFIAPPFVKNKRSPPIVTGLNRKIVVYPYNGIRYSNENKQTTTVYNLGESLNDLVTNSNVCVCVREDVSPHQVVFQHQLFCSSTQFWYYLPRCSIIFHKLGVPSYKTTHRCQSTVLKFQWPSSWVQLIC